MTKFEATLAEGLGEELLEIVGNCIWASIQLCDGHPAANAFFSPPGKVDDLQRIRRMGSIEQ